MSNQANVQPIHTEVSSAIEEIIIRVDFEGKQYEAKCSISAIAYQDKIRGILYFNNKMLEAVGIFNSGEAELLERKAKEILLNHLSAQADS